MPKVGEQSVTLEWLAKHRTPWLTRRMDKYSDLAVFRSLVSGPQELDIDFFEETYGLKPISSDRVSTSRIEKLLDLHTIGRRPVGVTLEEQVGSLLPEDNGVLGGGDQIRWSLTYLLSRIVMDSFPRKPDWVIDAAGLDPLTASLFFLNEISRNTGRPINWLEELHRPKTTRARVTQVHPLHLRPDGPSTWQWREILGTIRGQLNVLLHPHVREVSVSLATTRDPVQITRDELVKLLNVSERKATHTMQFLRLSLSERFIPAIRRLGLRYRYFFSQKQRYTVWSRGIIERMITGGPKVSSVCVHLEPSESDGSPEDNGYQVVVDSETLSFQLNRFVAEEEWAVGLWPSPKQLRSPKQIAEWLFHEDSTDRSKFRMTEKDLGILGVIWAFRGSQHLRNRVFGLMNVRSAMRAASIKRMLDQGIVSVMYHPTLDLCGLPEEVVLGIRNSPRREVQRVRNWLLLSLPYSRVLSSDSGRSLIVHGRLPIYRGGFFLNLLDKTLRNEFNVDFRVGRVDSSSSYVTTLPNRLYDSKTESWANPWQR